METDQAALETKVLGSLGLSDDAEPHSAPKAPQKAKTQQEPTSEDRAKEIEADLAAKFDRAEAKRTEKPEKASAPAKSPDVSFDDEHQFEETVRQETAASYRHEQAYQLWQADIARWHQAAAQVQRIPNDDQRARAQMQLHEYRRQLQARANEITQLGDRIMNSRQQREAARVMRHAERGRSELQKHFGNKWDHVATREYLATLGSHADPYALIKMAEQSRLYELGQQSKPAPRVINTLKSQTQKANQEKRPSQVEMEERVARHFARMPRAVADPSRRRR